MTYGTVMWILTICTCICNMCLDGGTHYVSHVITIIMGLPHIQTQITSRHFQSN